MHKYIVITMLILFPALSFANNNLSYDLYQFSTPAQQQRFQVLTKKLRCLVCQNQNLAESEAPLAADLRQQIATMLNQNKTNTQIMHYLVERYGDFVLYDPPFIKTTYILWLAPFVLLLLGLVILLYVIRHTRA